MSFAPQQPMRGSVFPLAPLVDIMFLLILFFVTTYSYSEEERQIDVSVPSAESGVRAVGRQLPITVNIMRDGTLVVAGKSHTLASLGSVISRLLKDSPDMTVVVRADENVPHGKVVGVYDMLRLAGAKWIRESVRQNTPGDGS